jgi:tRNA (cmo5U34)-methyltransferase
MADDSPVSEPACDEPGERPAAYASPEERLADAKRRFDSMDDYDRMVRLAIPDYDEMLGVVCYMVSGHEPKPAHVLDLGVGTGAVTERLARLLPDARFTGVDFSEAMLERARGRLAWMGDRLELVHADFRDFVPPADVTAAVSCLALHHLEHEDKRTVFGRLADALAGGGLFVLGDVLASPGERLAGRLRAWWVDRMEEARELGIDSDAVLDDHRDRDVPATLEQQTGWLREAGFAEVAPVWQSFTVAVIAALR